MISKVYTLEYWVEFENDFEIIKILGVYSSLDKAIQSAKKLQPDFEFKPLVDCPQGLYIEEDILDRTGWKTGFYSL